MRGEYQRFPFDDVSCKILQSFVACGTRVSAALNNIQSGQWKSYDNGFMCVGLPGQIISALRLTGLTPFGCFFNARSSSRLSATNHM